MARRMAGRVDDLDRLAAEAAKLSPPSTSWSMPGIFAASARGPMIVSAESLLQRQVGLDMVAMVVGGAESRSAVQPVRSMAARIGASSGASMSAVSPLSGSCTRTPKLSLPAHELFDLDGHGAISSCCCPNDRAAGRGCHRARSLKGVAPAHATVARHEFRHRRSALLLRDRRSAGWRSGRSPWRSSSIWAKLPNERLVGLGYALPWLDRFGADAERVFAFMPATQGAVNWPPQGPSATALVFDEELPLVDSSIDRMLLVHSLEHAENPRETLKEIWRVLAPGGRLVIVVPNRRGVWARFEHTPFGTGRPFSRGQLTGSAARGQFHARRPGPTRCFSRRRSGASCCGCHQLLERTGRRFWPMFSGVIVVEAQKRLYQGLPVAQRASRRVFVPVLSPQGATRAARDPC